MEKIQQEFEEWAIEHHFSTTKKPDGKSYAHDSTVCAFEGWKASRSSLCVELPQQGEVPAEMSMSWQPFYIMTSSNVIKMLEDAGVSYK